MPSDTGCILSEWISHLRVTSFESTARARPSFSAHARASSHASSSSSSSSSFSRPFLLRFLSRSVKALSSFPLYCVINSNSRESVVQREEQMEKARVKEKKRGALSLFLSLSLSLDVFRVVRFFVLARVVFPPCQSVCCIRVFATPVVFSQLFFFSHKFRVHLSLLGLLDPVSETTTFFRPSSSEHPPLREREREREAAMKIHLKTLYVVLSTFSGGFALFLRRFRPPFVVVVFSTHLLLSPLSLLIRFSNRDIGIQNDSDSKRTCVSSSSSRRIQNDRTAQSSTST